MKNKVCISNDEVSLRTEKQELRFSDAADIWLEAKRNTVKESSFAQYYRIVNSILKPEWAELFIYQITDAMLEEFGDKIYEKYKYKSAKSTIITANQIFEHSYKHGYIVNRQRIITKTKTCKITRPQVFTNAEQKILTDYLFKDCDLKKLGILICLYSGLRLGEICGLKWSDVDMKNGIIKVNRTIQRISDGTGSTHFLIGTPKSDHSEREVPIPSFLQDTLKEVCTDKEYYVTTGSFDFTQPRTYQNTLKRYLKECDLPNYHFHSLRHTFASRAIELGFDPKTLSEILGHANVKITLDLYVHPSLEQKKRNMELFTVFVEDTQK